MTKLLHEYGDWIFRIVILLAIGLNLYLPYILIVFLIVGVSKILYGKAQEFVGAEEGQFE